MPFPLSLSLPFLLIFLVFLSTFPFEPVFTNILYVYLTMTCPLKFCSIPSSLSLLSLCLLFLLSNHVRTSQGSWSIKELLDTRIDSDENEENIVTTPMLDATIIPKQDWYFYSILFPNLNRSQSNNLDVETTTSTPESEMDRIREEHRQHNHSKYRGAEKVFAGKETVALVGVSKNRLRFIRIGCTTWLVVSSFRSDNCRGSSFHCSLHLAVPWLTTELGDSDWSAERVQIIPPWFGF